MIAHPHRYIVLYFALGCVMDVIGMLVLTLPVIFPVIVKLGFDPIWFGVLVTVMIELSLITIRSEPVESSSERFSVFRWARYLRGGMVFFDGMYFDCTPGVHTYLAP